MGKGKFLKAASICSMIGGVTTLVLVLMQVPVVENFNEKVLLHENALYLNRLWIFFFHPQLCILAVLGAGLVLVKKKPELIIPGVLFFLIWGITEAAQQAFTIDAVNQTWRAGYAGEKDEAIKAAYFAQLIGADAIRDSMYFLLLYCFGIGSSLLGIALLGEGKLASAVSVGFIFFGILSLCAFLNYYVGFKFFDRPVDFAFTWIYPVLQPISRFSLGIWLWKRSKQDMSGVNSF